MTAPPTPQPEPPPLIDLPDLPHAWSSPYLAAFDTLRVLVALGSLYLLYLLAFAAFVSKYPPQRALSGAFALAVLVDLWTQVERIGRPVSWRFPVVTAMVVLGVWGALRYMTAGHRLRDIRLSSLFIPPPPPPPAEPPDMARRLRRHTRPDGDPPP